MTSVLLRDSLGDWTDFDVAGYRLGEFLGVIPPERSFGSVKGSFWIDGFRSASCWTKCWRAW